MSPTAKVYRKEVKEFMRDRRVRSTALIMPFFLICLMVYMMGTLTKTLSDKSGIKLHVVGSVANNPLLKTLEEEKVQLVPVASLEAGKKLVKDGKARVVMDFPSNLQQKLAANQRADLTVLYDSKTPTSEIAVSAIQQAVDQINRESVKETLSKNHLPASAAAPLQLDKKDVSSQKPGASEFVLSFLPYFIVVWAFYGCMGIAADSVAGEKEKSTLETLLITPVKRTQIVTGKFLALGSVALMSSLSCLLGLVFMSILKPAGTESFFQHGLGVSGEAAGVIIIVLVPTVAFFAGLLIAISSFAKNSREAQTYLGTTSLVVITPAIISQFIGFTDFASAKWINFVPVLNTAMAIRNALLNKTDYSAVAATVAAGLILSVVGIALAVRLFNREEVLTRV